MKYIAIIEIETNYTKSECKEVIDKLLSIPGAEYVDCKKWNTSYKLVII